jgi:prevent-host-death family protein
MTVVGITELKAHLSKYLRRAQVGERFDITYRGADVAQLGPPDPVRGALLRMIAAGEAEWSGDQPASADDRILNPGRPLSDLVSEDRGPHLPGDDPPRA